MADPYILQSVASVTVGKPYTISSLFTYVPGTPPTWPDNPPTGPINRVVLAIAANSNVVFSTPLDPNGYYDFLVDGSTVAGDAPYVVDWSTATVTFNSSASLGGLLAWDFPTTYYGGYQLNASVGYGFSVLSSLFTTGNDTVNFNNLTADQQAAITAGAETTNGLGGRDTVTLNSTYSTFSTGSNVGDTTSVTAGSGNYNITLGAGSDTVTINGNGSSNITAGSGADTISITGNGNNTINGGTGTASVLISGTGDSTFDGNLTGSVSISGGGTLDITGNLSGTANIAPGSTLQLGGTASGLTVNTSATLDIEGGGAATGTTINTGGFVYVESGGQDINPILAGGDEYDENNGDDINAIIENGAIDDVKDGGVSTNPTVDTGGELIVESDPGTVVDPKINGGLVKFQVGGNLTGPVTFIANTGTLEIDGASSSNAPTITVSGFQLGDVILFANQPNLTLEAAYPSTGTNEVDVYSGNQQIATLSFNGGAPTINLEPVNVYGAPNIGGAPGGTEIVVDQTNISQNDPQPPGEPAGVSIHWNIIHDLEGGNWLNPYVPNSSSGLTVGIGVDVFNNLKLSDFSGIPGFGNYANMPNLNFLAQEIVHRYTGAGAITKLNGRAGQITENGITNSAAQSVSITQSQANALTNKAEQLQLKILENTIGSGLTTLPWQAQTALMDMVFNIGHVPGKLQKDNSPVLQDVNAAIKALSTGDPTAINSSWATLFNDVLHVSSPNNSRIEEDGALILQLYNGPNIPAPTIEQGTQVASNDWSYNFDLTAGPQYEDDPSGPYLTLLEDSGSPPIATVQLPSYDAASSYLVSYEIGTTWSAPQTAQPDQILTLPAGGVNGLKVVMLDGNGNPIVGSPDFAFFLTFASAGTFSGTVLSTSTTATTDDGSTDVTTGHVVTITVMTGEPETVIGTPTLALSDNEVATYTGGTGTDTLTFSYTVQPGDSTLDLQVTGLNLPNSATIQDSAGNPLTEVAQDLGLQISTTSSAPVISTLVGRPINGSPLEVKGTGEAGDTVTLYADGSTTPVGTGIVASDGSFDIITSTTFAKGSHALTASQTDAQGLTSAASSAFPVTVNVPPKADFTGTGTSDVLLQAGGTVVDWIMDDGQYQAGNVLTNGAAGWQVVGTGDFTGKGISGALLQNGGTVVDWIMNDGQYQAGNVLTNGAAGWQVVGTGDFNGDGTSDVVLQDGGTVVDWTMDNGAYQGGSVLTNGAAGWQVVGTGDFTGSGTSDVVLQNGGTVVDWIMQNGAYSTGNVLTNGATGWQVVGTGDFSGSGTSDVLLQNGGTVVDWIMQNGKYVSGNVLTTAAAGWTVVGTGDYNGDGTSDVLVQDGGTVVDWIIKNGAFQSGNVITNGAAGFQVVKT